mmetsp:Transcript_93254/g.267435  ORF Transcript_93254/g.267435 Transcript_93254/m.267435 type:complete len:205 (+) Transcript_93254:268-882(+)
MLLVDQLGRSEQSRGRGLRHTGILRPRCVYHCDVQLGQKRSRRRGPGPEASESLQLGVVLGRLRLGSLRWRKTRDRGTPTTWTEQDAGRRAGEPKFDLVGGRRFRGRLGPRGVRVPRRGERRRPRIAACAAFEQEGGADPGRGGSEAIAPKPRLQRCRLEAPASRRSCATGFCGGSAGAAGRAAGARVGEPERADAVAGLLLRR